MTVGGSSATATATATASAPASPLATPSTPTAVAPPGAPPQSGALVFSAFDRTTAVQGIYRADPDGTHIRRITPADGRVYNWPRWAFGGTKIVYTVRAGEAGSPEAIAMMDPDGGNPTVLRAFDYRVGQPTVDGTGRWLYFTATAPWFQHVAVYRMDLHTLLSRNITAVTQPKGGFDADPFVTRDGSVLVATSSATGTSIERLAADGATRAKVTSGTWHDTDPDESPDGSLVALASYRGPGTPQAPTGGGFVGGEFAGVRTSPWRIVVTSRDGRSERVLTAGADCVLRGPEKACTIPQMSGFAPRFSPDGTRVGFVGALDRARTCICTLGVTGAQPRALLESLTLSIDWFDWLRRTGDPAAASRIGAARSTDRLLVTMRDNSGTSQLFETSADLMDRTVVQLPARLKPLQAHWGPDGRSIVFTANVPVPARDGAPHPAPPPGQQRRDHVTLADIDALSVALRSLQPEALERSRAQEQVFLRAPDGSVGQLTDPWIEDWRDGVALGDARANTDPILSADGHTLVVTNISTTTGESFLLRINLATGAVLNLTNATAGALPATDGEAALSPDGAWIAFSWVEGGARQVYLMSARDGSGVRALTRASGSARMPSWLPDGSAVVQVHEVAGRLALELVSVTGDGRTGATRVLTGVLPGPGWRPVPSPDGSRILVLGTTTAGRIGPFLVPVRGGAPSLIQADPMHDVLSVDWRRP